MIVGHGNCGIQSLCRCNGTGKSLINEALINVQCRCMWKILEAGCMEEMHFVVVGNVGVTSIVLCWDGIGKVHPQERIQVCDG